MLLNKLFYADMEVHFTSYFFYIFSFDFEVAITDSRIEDFALLIGLHIVYLKQVCYRVASKSAFKVPFVYCDVIVTFSFF